MQNAGIFMRFSPEGMHTVPGDNASERAAAASWQCPRVLTPGVMHWAMTKCATRSKTKLSPNRVKSKASWYIPVQNDDVFGVRTVTQACP